MSKLWGCVVKTGEPAQLELEGQELDLMHAVLLGNKACTVKATSHVDDEGDDDDEEQQQQQTLVIARLTPNAPNARMHVVFTNNTSFELVGPPGESVQLVGNLRKVLSDDDEDESEIDEEAGEGLEGLDMELLQKLRNRFNKKPGDDDSGDDDSDGDSDGLGDLMGCDDDDSDDDDDEDDECDEDDDDDDEGAGVERGLHPQIEEIDEDNDQNKEDKKENKKNEKPFVEIGGMASDLSKSGGKSSVPASFGEQLRKAASNAPGSQEKGGEGVAKRKQPKPSEGFDDESSKPSNAKRAKTVGQTEAPQEKEVSLQSEGAKAKKNKKKKTGEEQTTTKGDAGQEGNLGIKKQLKAGVNYEVLTVGNGSIASVGKKVDVLYEGRLKSNNKSFDKGKLSFVLGRGEMISGFDLGVRGMMVGEKRRVFVPSNMGYGPKRTGPIPPNSDLIFDITLKNVK